MVVQHSSLCRQTKVPKKFGPFVQVGGELAKDKNLFLLFDIWAGVGCLVCLFCPGGLETKVFENFG